MGIFKQNSPESTVYYNKPLIEIETLCGGEYLKSSRVENVNHTRLERRFEIPELRHKNLMLSTYKEKWKM